MLASGAVRAAGERSVPWTAAAPAAAAFVVCFCALLFSGGAGQAQLVWIGALALLAAALVAAAVLVGALPVAPLPAPAVAYLGCLFGLALWAGASTVWSTSPDRSWAFANRTLVYAAFAVLGVLLAGLLPRAASVLATAAAMLLAPV